jgi:hypothetical protein
MRYKIWNLKLDACGDTKAEALKKARVVLMFLDGGNVRSRTVGDVHGNAVAAWSEGAEVDVEDDSERDSALPVENLYVVIYREGRRKYKTVVEAVTIAKARRKFARENPDTTIVSAW